MLIFWTIAGVALLLLVVNFLAGDAFDGALDSVGLGDGFVSATAILSFLACFGIVGGIVMSSTSASALVASIAGVGAGLVGAAAATWATNALRDGPTAHQITSDDYVDLPATVTTSIPVGGPGQIHLTVAGHPTALAAYAQTALPAGTRVVVTESLGSGMVRVAVAPDPSATPDRAEDRPTG